MPEVGEVIEDYFTLRGEYGPHGDKLDTLDAAVEAAVAYIGKLNEEHPGIEDPTRVVWIEHRQLVDNGGWSKTDSAVASFTHDGERPHDFEYVARRLGSVIWDLKQRVYTGRDIANLGNGRRALDSLRALANVVERGIAEVEAEQARGVTC